MQLSLTSCKNFYKATSTTYKNNTEKTEAVDKLNSANKTFILRSGATAYEMKNLVVNTEKTILECTLDTLSAFNKLHLTKGKKGNMQYKQNWPEHTAVLNEVHIYIAPGTEAANGKYTLALDKIQKVEVIEKDKGRTNESYILGGIGITAGVAIIALTIIAITFSINWNGF
jgi:hypothetical protein